MLTAVLLTWVLFFLVGFVTYLGFEFLRVWRNGHSKFHTLRSLTIHFLLNRFVFRIGATGRRKLEYDTVNFPFVQEDFLMNILKKNARTKYGEDFKFGRILNRRDFVNCHPITTYDHYKNFVERIAKGEKNVMTHHEPWMLAVTSGTTGKSCLIPKTRDNSRAFVKYGFAVGVYHTIFGALPQADSLQKCLKLFHAPEIKYSKGGIPIGPSTLAPSLQLHALSTPRMLLDVPSVPTGLYIHLLFAIRDRDLGSIWSNFAYYIHGVFIFLEENWKLMVQDIEKGEISSDLEITERVRSDLNKLLKPDTQRANELRREFEKGFDEIARRIWPNLKYVHGVVSGSSELYATQLRGYYLKGVPLYSTIYGATEGLIGVNLWPLEETPCYLLVPRSMFFEFLPIENSHEEQPKTMFGENVHVGCLYELIVTTLSGLYRYRIGDVVEVVRFHNSCPVVRFQYRQGQLLNMRSEKTSEAMIFEAITKVTRKNGENQLVDYTCAESILLDYVPNGRAVIKEPGFQKRLNHTGLGTGVKPFYLVFLELSPLIRKTVETEALEQELDEALCEINPYYLTRRENGGFIGRLRVCLVQPGTFQKFQEFLLQATPTAVNQLKIPRKLTSKKQLMFFINELGLKRTSE